MSRWVSCKKELPEPQEDVLMFFDHGDETYMAMGFLCGIDEGTPSWCAYTGGSWYTDCDESPDYWALPPKPPGRRPTT